MNDANQAGATPGQGMDKAPAVERDGKGWICRDRRTGEIVPNFEGVAYCDDLQVFVHTYKSGADRGMWELGARSYEGALAEALHLQRQMSLGF